MKHLRMAALLASAGLMICGAAHAQSAVGYTDLVGGVRKTLDVRPDQGLPVTVVGGSPVAKAVVTTDKSGSITSGGTAQTAIALNASRQAWCIQNPATATESLYVRVNGTASATTGSEVTPGNQACSQPGSVDTAAVSVFAATTGHAWLGFEKQ